MTYLVFDCRKAVGYLFETRHKWLAHWFCVVASWFGDWRWDWSSTMDFDDMDTVWRRDYFDAEEHDWNEVYHHGS